MVNSSAVAMVRHGVRYWRHARPNGRDPVLSWLSRIPTRYETTIDIGAHHGLYSRALAGVSDMVLCVEPIPDLARGLAGILPPNCKIHQIAMSDRQGRITLATPMRRGRPDYALTSAAPRRHRDRDRIERIVACSRVDDLLRASLAPGRVGLIKIDVEGHEAAVLRGARNTLVTHRPTILIEAEERHGCDIGALFHQMEKDGYSGHMPWFCGAQRTSADMFLSRQRASRPGEPEPMPTMCCSTIKTSARRSDLSLRTPVRRRQP